MKFYSNNIVQEVRNLKIQGVAISKIAKKFNVSRSTISRWVFDMPSTNPNYLKNQKVRIENRLRGEKYISNFKINQKNVKLFTALIYWCEGYKYPHCNFIGFTNSDVNLVETFLKLFRSGFNPKEEKFRIHLQIHDTHDKNEVIDFWSNKLKIPKNQFRKSTITKARSKMKRTNYNGTCTVRYYDSAIYQEIMGIYETFFRKIVKIGEVG